MNGKGLGGAVFFSFLRGWRKKTTVVTRLARNPMAMDPREAELVAFARQAQQQAYAPYSRFKVGAALLAADGRVFVGCNVENASLGATTCAERAAVYAAVSGGAREFTKLVVVTDEQEPVMPCGLCRQVLLEFSSQMEVVAVGAAGQIRRAPLNSLLPYGFKLKKPTTSASREKR